MRGLRHAPKEALIFECREAGLPANRNVPNIELLHRLEAYLTGWAYDTAMATEDLCEIGRASCRERV